MQPKSDEVTEVPKLAVEPDPVTPVGDQDLELPPEPARARRRRPSADASEVAEERPPSPGPDVSVTERQLAKAFYWGYRAWCKLLGAKIEAHSSEFEDLGKAWLELARKFPGIRWVIAGAGPIFTMTDLVDKLARAWEARTRLRGEFRIPNWRQRTQNAGAEPTEATVVEYPSSGGA